MQLRCDKERYLGCRTVVPEGTACSFEVPCHTRYVFSRATRGKSSTSASPIELQLPSSKNFESVNWSSLGNCGLELGFHSFQDQRWAEFHRSETIDLISPRIIPIRDMI
jgi:hypothetical protein